MSSLQEGIEEREEEKKRTCALEVEHVRV